jgi:hypothetical protein
VAKKSMIKNPGKENFFLNGRKIVLGWPTRNTSNWCSATGSEIMKSTECLSKKQISSNSEETTLRVTCEWSYVTAVFTINFLTYQPGGLVPMEFLQVPPGIKKQISSNLMLSNSTKVVSHTSIINLGTTIHLKPNWTYLFQSLI